MQRRQAATGSCGRGPRDRHAAAVAFALPPVLLLARSLPRPFGRGGRGAIGVLVAPHTSSLSGTYLGAAIIRLSG